MISNIRVWERLRLLAQVEEADSTAIMPLCAQAAAEIGARLKTPEAAGDLRVEAAAAALAFYLYTLHQRAADGNVASFKAGDVTVTSDKQAVEAAAMLRDEALRAAAPLLVDESFCFRKAEV